jgi:hypothetical protein
MFILVPITLRWQALPIYFDRSGRTVQKIERGYFSTKSRSKKHCVGKQALKFQATGKLPSIVLNQFKSASIILEEKYFHKFSPQLFMEKKIVIYSIFMHCKFETQVDSQFKFIYKNKRSTTR